MDAKDTQNESPGTILVPIRLISNARTMEIGTIKAVHIYVHDQLYVTAELELNIKGVNHKFGGHRVFLSGMHGGESSDVPYLGRFLFRCMQVCNVENWDLLKSSKVLADIRDGRVIAIGSASGQNWFNPTREFGIMEDEKELSGTSYRLNTKTSG